MTAFFRRAMLTRAVTRVAPGIPTCVGTRHNRGRSVVAWSASASSSSGDEKSDVGPDHTGNSGTVTITFRGRPVTVCVGSTLRSSLLRTGETPHNGNAKVVNCRGLGTCGTCAVEISPSDAVFPETWNGIEKARLNFPPHSAPGNEKLRLGCRVHIRKECEIIKYDKFWGQGGDLSEESVDGANTTPLGELEYLLDKEEK